MGNPEYSLGFLFKRSRLTNEFTEVCLITKDHPEWMKDRLNGVGGKLEQGETPLQCMIREFEEETGARITNWQPVATLVSMHATTMFVFKGWCYDEDVVIRNRTREPVGWYALEKDTGWSDEPYYADLATVPNLHWLIPMCLFDPDYMHYIEDSKRG